MIEKISYKNNYRVTELLEFLNNNEDYDFYYYRDNARNYIRDTKTLKSFLKESICNYAYTENGDCKGIILVSRMIVDNKKKFYVKINTSGPKIAIDLLTILLWNFDKDLYINIKYDSKFMDVLKYKGFRFINSKGNQVLLERKSFPLDKNKIYVKEEDTK